MSLRGPAGSPGLNAFQPREWTEYMCRVVQCDVWILLMLLSKSPDIHFTVVVELGGKNGDAVQHRLNVTLLNWPLIEPDASSTNATAASRVSSLF